MKNKSYQKICKKCGCNSVIKFGKKRGKQRYKCKGCEHVFVNQSRKKKSPSSLLWKDYVFGKQTYKQLSETYGISVRTVQKLLDEYELPQISIPPKEIVLLIDTTYFGDFGIMAFKDYENGDILKFKMVENENYVSYRFGVDELLAEGWKIRAIVCDGKKGLLGGFGGIPTQMCNFHQVQIITRYITKRPRLSANKDLRALSLLLTKTDKETFTYYLEQWYLIYGGFIKEKAINEKGKSYYIHKRTRSAYFSLKRNLKYLFTWYDYLGQVDIPNTTNGLEGFFSHVKTKVRVHSGLKKERKIKLILSLLYQKI